MAEPQGQGVVVGVDGSPHSHRALDWAIRAAAVHRAPLHLVHVLEHPYAVHAPPAPRAPQFAAPAEPRPDVAWAAAEQTMADLVQKAREDAPGLDVQDGIVRGSPVHALLDASTNATMLVVGTHGHSALAGLPLGSVTSSVVTHGSVPVVVARPTPTSEPAHVVVGVDGSPQSAAAITFAFAEAAARHHVLRPVFVQLNALDHVGHRSAATSLSPDDVSEADFAAVTRSLAGARTQFPGVTVEQRFLHGHPVPALAAASVDASLLVVGSRGHGAFSRLLLGSVSLGLLHLAECPVAVVRHR